MLHLVLLLFSCAFSQISYNGIVVDIYCWNLPNHVALDGALLQTAPQNHSVHCMRDVPNCYRGGFGFLENSGTTQNPNYILKYVFDASTNDKVINILGSTPTLVNFQLSATGATVDQSTPPIMTASMLVETSPPPPPGTVITGSGFNAKGPAIIVGVLTGIIIALGLIYMIYDAFAGHK